MSHRWGVPDSCYAGSVAAAAAGYGSHYLNLNFTRYPASHSWAWVSELVSELDQLLFVSELDRQIVSVHRGVRQLLRLECPMQVARVFILFQPPAQRGLFTRRRAAAAAGVRARISGLRLHHPYHILTYC